VHGYLAGLTLREAVALPLPLLEERLSPRASPSKTQQELPRTFGDILPWTRFLEGSRELFNSLDDIEHIGHQLSCIVKPSSRYSSAASKIKVMSCVFSLLENVSEIADILKIPVECCGGGSGRSMSFTDLVVRPAGACSDPAHVSSQILGTGEVKGDWDFSLKRGERLEDALHDPDRIGGIVQAVQQVSAGRQCRICNEDFYA